MRGLLLNPFVSLLQISSLPDPDWEAVDVGAVLVDVDVDADVDVDDDVSVDGDDGEDDVSVDDDVDCAAVEDALEVEEVAEEVTWSPKQQDLLTLSHFSWMNQTIINTQTHAFISLTIVKP